MFKDVTFDWKAPMLEKIEQWIHYEVVISLQFFLCFQITPLYSAIFKL